MTAMDIAIHATFLPHDDPNPSLAFYRDALGFIAAMTCADGTVKQPAPALSVVATPSIGSPTTR
jgi:hypothetical protein